MLDETRPGAWLVRAGAGEPPEAFVERFTRGYKLSSWSLVESERRDLGVYMSAELAETAWWRRRESSSRSPSS
ncbi:hypothetical protein [Frondihabitans australicus]|uniref:Uncharacterized protein n=1 Tax=Frondihabitans australicus TaxID=386892 RepID=A0A495IFM1_9MICO|nr:hypothetical protein [Frondihabitans australicus]RKR74218.1 hypothetical protein C8E83_1326 [Frondihabitans australicus]